MERQGRALVAQRPGARGWEGAGWRTLGRLVIFPVHWCERGWWTRERDSSLGTQSEAVDKALAGSGSWSLAIFGGGGYFGRTHPQAATATATWKPSDGISGRRLTDGAKDGKKKKSKTPRTGGKRSVRRAAVVLTTVDGPCGEEFGCLLAADGAGQMQQQRRFDERSIPGISFDSRLRKVKGRNKGRREKWKEKRINRSETIARMQTGGLVGRRERKKQGGRRTNGSPVCTVASYSSYSNQRRRGSNLSIHHSNDWTSGPQPQLQEPWNEQGKDGRSAKMAPKKQTPHDAYPLIHVLFKQKR